MISNTAQENYLATKYSLDNLKKDKVKILRGDFLKGYGISLYSKDIIQKTYYDLPDTFFNKVGITININKIKNAPKADLVVRYNSNAKRIQFLNDIPETFVKQIGLHSSIKDNIDFITNAIYELIPNGISADVKALLQNVKPVMVVEKKRERYRLINANGLKLIMSFCNSVYHNKINGIKQKPEVLELQSNTIDKHTEYDTFNKLMRFEFANLIKLKESDLEIGLEMCEK